MTNKQNSRHNRSRRLEHIERRLISLRIAGAYFLGLISKQQADDARKALLEK